MATRQQSIEIRMFRGPSGEYGWRARAAASVLISRSARDAVGDIGSRYFISELA